MTTDGFLLPNAELERRGLMHRKGFPESYDRRALLRFVMEVKSGARRGRRAGVRPPGLRHRARRAEVAVRRPDILIVEGLNVLQPARVRADGTTGLAVSDFFDFSVYVDADADDVRDWYVTRFLSLRETAFRDPRSYFTRYAELTPTQAVRQAETLWDTINGPTWRRTSCPPAAGPPRSCARTPTTGSKWVRIRKV